MCLIALLKAMVHWVSSGETRWSALKKQSDVYKQLVPPFLDYAIDDWRSIGSTPEGLLETMQRRATDMWDTA